MAFEDNTGAPTKSLLDKELENKETYDSMRHWKREDTRPVIKYEPVLALIEDNFALEALDNFIIVQEDKFRTGYECKACDGEGHGNKVCPSCKGSKVRVLTNKCEICDGDGRVRDLRRELGETADMIKFKKCKECNGTGKRDLGKVEEGLYPCNACIVIADPYGTGRAVPSGFVPCTTCKGKPVSIVVPEDSLRRPNSGIIRSIGPKVGWDERGNYNPDHIKCGDRVLYSNHTGYEVSFKRQMKFRQMREHEVMSRIHGVKKIHEVLE